ncbi:MAG: helix-turn-helix domain-containing protein [Burkholderiaceae bacterium]
MQTTLLVDALKRELKARDITYAQLAERIEMSEASVKRMLSTRNFTLERLDDILAATGIELTELLRLIGKDDKLITQLTDKQEREIVASPELFAVAVACLNQMTFEEIVGLYKISETDCIKLLVKLDKMGFIELQAGNRIRLKVARTFHWIPSGPIMQLFRAESLSYFDTDFTRVGEKLILVNAMLSRGSIEKFIERMQEVAREFSQLHGADINMPFDKRHAHSLLLAVRPWEPEFMRKLRRNPDKVR